MSRTLQAPPPHRDGDPKMPPPPSRDDGTPWKRTNRMAGADADALARVFAAGLLAPVRLKPSDRLAFARHAVIEFIATLDAEVLK
jgi:hypothetical protein